jgi:hypothetical protein
MNIRYLPPTEHADLPMRAETSTDTATDGSGDLYTPGNSGQSAVSAFIDVWFESHQDADHGPDGKTCTRWTLRYTFVQSNGLWLIHDTAPQPGTAGHSACW